MIRDYFDACLQQLSLVAEESSGEIQAAAEAVAEAIAGDRGFFLFGSGHSALIAREAFWRAGGLAPALPIPDPMAGDVERLSGFAARLLGHYDLRPGGAIIVISNSGINHLPVEVAIECKARGLTVIAITSLAHSQSVAARHPSGKKLADLADIVVDTHGVTGDAVLELAGVDLKVGPTSTVIGVAIVEAITSQAAARLLERGIQPPVLISSNTPGGDAHNRELAQRYRPQLIRYEVPTVDAPTQR
jgi:uncharacterized phosphosugar-binding protein